MNGRFYFRDGKLDKSIADLLPQGERVGFLSLTRRDPMAYANSCAQSLHDSISDAIGRSVSWVGRDFTVLAHALEATAQDEQRTRIAELKSRVALATEAIIDAALQAAQSIIVVGSSFRKEERLREVAAQHAQYQKKHGLP